MFLHGMVTALAVMAPADLRTMVVLEVEANGVKAELASVLSDTMVQELRATGAVGRIMGTRDIQAAVGLESQEQLLQCESEGCMAELAGSLAADHLLAASPGTVGGYDVILDITLISARSGSLSGSAGARVCSSREGAVLLVTSRAAR